MMPCGCSPSSAGIPICSYGSCRLDSRRRNRISRGSMCRQGRRSEPNGSFRDRSAFPSSSGESGSGGVLGIFLICRTKRRLIILALLAVTLTAPLLPVAAAPAWMPVADVRPGMRGVGRTVVAGTKVESFDVQILEIVPGAGPAGDLILIRASGPLIARTGGIAAGMSGSPVYVNGRLVGAIGYGWAFADHSLGLVTPIETMLRALPSTRSERRPLGHPVQAGGRRIEGVTIVSKLAGARGPQNAAPGVAGVK